MLGSRLFNKLYFSFSVLIIFTGVVTGLLVHHQLKENLHHSSERSLKNQVYYLANFGNQLFNSDDFASIKKDITRIQNQTSTRITLINDDGSIYADSLIPPSEWKTRSLDPEFLDAIHGELPVVRRYSHSQSHKRLYAAKALFKGSRILGVIRVSIPLENEIAAMESLNRQILWGTVIGVCLALVLGIFLTRKILVPLLEMLQVAEALRHGNYEKRVHTTSKDEIGQLGRAFNRLGKELSRTIQHLSHEESQLRVILSNMKEGVIALDNKDTILFCNASAMKLLGSETPILPGNMIWQFPHLRETSALVKRLKENGTPQEKEVKLTIEGRELTLSVRVNSFKGTETSGVMIVIQDITEIRRYEEVRREFVANVSHELKTPLTSIKGYVETLLDGALDDDKHNRRFLTKIQDHSNQLTNLVQDILKIGQIESSEMESDDLVDWIPILKQSIGHLELELDRNHIKCVLPDTKSKFLITGNSTSMAQIAENLLSNAIKYTPEGGNIWIRLSKEEDKWVVLEVEDSGIGIPQSDLPRIFERFYRVDKARSRAVGGTGLGLSIVKHLVNSMEGEVSVRSELGKGSCFCVKLPIHQANRSMTIPPSKLPRPSHPLQPQL